MSDVLPDHALLSPSSSYRWLKCPASKHCPPSSSGPAAEAGTLGHAASEDVLRRGKVDDIELLALEDTVFAGASQLVSSRDASEIADATAVYVEEVAGRPGEKLLEQKLFHPTIPDFFGTIDCLIVSPEHLEIFDLKCGKWPAHHEQLMCYGVLANQEHPRPIIHATIIQPRSIGQKRAVHFWTSDELARFEDRVREAAESDDVVPNDGCRFCTLRPTCLPGREYATRAGW